MWGVFKADSDYKEPRKPIPNQYLELTYIFSKN